MMNEEMVVYCYTNIVNGKKYVGITKVKPEKRWNQGRGYSRGQTRFYNAITKYGWENFDHEIIASNLTESEACHFEKLLIEKLDLQNPDKGYNISPGGQSAPQGYSPNADTRAKLSAARKGHIVTEETRAKISKANIGKHPTEETRIKMSQAKLGHKLSEEHKQKLLASVKGKPRTEEYRRKLSEAHRGEKHYMYGKHHSAETKAKMSAARMGRQWTEETNIKRSNSHKQHQYNKYHPVEQYTLDGAFVCTHHNLIQAADAMIAEHNLTRKPEGVRDFIRQAASGWKNSAYGYIWKRPENIKEVC